MLQRPTYNDPEHLGRSFLLAHARSDKLVQRTPVVCETPSRSMCDQVMAAWSDSTKEHSMADALVMRS